MHNLFVLLLLALAGSLHYKCRMTTTLTAQWCQLWLWITSTAGMKQSWHSLEWSHCLCWPVIWSYNQHDHGFHLFNIELLLLAIYFTSLLFYRSHHALEGLEFSDLFNLFQSYLLSSRFQCIGIVIKIPGPMQSPTRCVRSHTRPFLLLVDRNSAASACFPPSVHESLGKVLLFRKAI